MVEKEKRATDPEICPKCGQAMLKLPEGKYNCGCQPEKDFNEEDPCLDMGYDIGGFVWTLPA